MRAILHSSLILLICLVSQGGRSQPVRATPVPPAAGPDQPSLGDGIIDAGETLDSPVLQTHLNPRREPSSDILSTYFLRDYITAQVEAFKFLGSEEESFLPWALPLTTHLKTVGVETRLVRYNIEKRKVPQYKYNYKYVTKTIYVREGGSSRDSVDSPYAKDKRTPAGKLVKRTIQTRELVSVKQVGVRTVQVKVPNPEGKFEEKLQFSVTESTGVARLPHGWHAANARIVLTMLKAGLPATDPQIKLIVQSFNNLLFGYGIPDTTEDVAWLTAVYSNLPQSDPDVKGWSGKLVSKLVSGAAQIGDHKGMWGPVCVNPKYVDELVAFDMKFVAKNITPLENEVRMENGARAKARLQQELAARERLYDQWQQVYLTWAMAGTSAQNPRGQTTIPANTDDQKDHIFNYSLQVPGLVQDAYHFQFTDIDSTCIALFALSEAQAAGILPDRTLVPTDNRGKALAKPVEVRKQLAACCETLKSLRLRTGGWDSCYSSIYQSICREIAYAATFPKDGYGKSKSENHWAFNVMGLAAMEYLARIAGGAEAERMRKESAEYQVTLIQWLLDHTAELDLPNAPASGDMLYFLADVIGSRDPDSQFLWQQIGAIGLGESADIAMLDVIDPYDSSSARMSLQTEQEYYKAHPLNPEVAGTEEAANPAAVETMRQHRIRSLSQRAAITYFLAKGVRQPVFAAVKTASGNGTCPALDYLMSSKVGGIALNYFYVTSANDLARYSTALFLVMERDGAVALSRMEMENLADYISGNGGTVVLLGVPGKSTESIERETAAMLASGGLEYETTVGDRRGCRCVEYRAGGRLAAIVLDASPDQVARETYSKRLKVYQSLMKEKLPETYLENRYCLLPERVSNGELTLTGVEWESGAGTIKR